MTLPLIVMTTVLAMCVLLSWFGSTPPDLEETNDDLERHLRLQRDNAGADRTGFVAPGAAVLDDFADDEDGDRDGHSEVVDGEVINDDERETA